VLDSVVAAETPEGILLELRPAGMSSRFCAYLIDELIRMAILYAAAFVLMFVGGVGFAVRLRALGHRGIPRRRLRARSRGLALRSRDGLLPRLRPAR